MAEGTPSYGDLKQRLDQAEELMVVLREGQADAVVGSQRVALLRCAETEKLLERNRARLEAALQAAGGALYERPMATGMPAACTDEWSAMLGYETAEIPVDVGFYEWFQSHVHPDDWARIDQAYQAFGSGSSEAYDQEFRLRHKRGHWMWVRELARAIQRDPSGRATEFVGVMFDVTEQKQREEELEKSRATAVDVMEDAVESRRRIEIAERELRTLNETLEQKVAARTALAEQRAKRLRRLAAELSEAEQKQRKRLSKLLHDDLQQLLLAVKLRLPVLLDCDPSQRVQEVNRLEELMEESVQSARHLSHELNPPILQRGSMAEIIEWLAQRFRDMHRMTVAVDYPDTLPGVNEDVRVFLFHAVRELLVNVVKHADSLHARVTLAGGDRQVTVQVESEGQEFDPQYVTKRLDDSDSFGLFHIRERLAAFGGCLEIESSSSGRACFRLIVPVTEHVEP